MLSKFGHVVHISVTDTSPKHLKSDISAFGQFQGLSLPDLDMSGLGWVCVGSGLGLGRVWRGSGWGVAGVLGRSGAIVGAICFQACCRTYDTYT